MLLTVRNTTATTRVDGYEVVAVGASHLQADTAIVICHRPERAEHDAYICWYVGEDHDQPYWGVSGTLEVALDSFFRRAIPPLT